MSELLFNNYSLLIIAVFTLQIGNFKFLLLPSKMSHIMLSYNWNVQPLVKKVYQSLVDHGYPVWVDFNKMTSNINDSMSEGVDNAFIICPFMTSNYFNSKNCKKELNYADDQCKEIAPIMAEDNFKAKGWLGIITAGLLWMDFRSTANFDISMKSLMSELQHRCTDIQLSKPLPEAPKFKGRAFRNQQHGHYLAESGEVKYEYGTGTRSTLCLRVEPEATSFWVEERSTTDKSILYYKNYETDMYLGYDPNGDYIYTKGQHYGAEEWSIVAEDSVTSGERAVVLFAVYGKKYLAVRDGKLTGVNNRDKDCVWILG